MTDTDSRPATRRASLMLMCLSVTATAQAADPITEALSNGETNLDARYRYELVDQEGVPKDAGASTLRTRLGYRTGEVSGFTGFLEAEHVTQLGGDTYNSTINGVDNRPVVADPAETEINQAWVRYEGLADTQMTYGRQRFFLDNHRFIGTVGWRQNEQTFDGFTIVNESLPDTTLTGGYLYNANRIFSDASPNGNAPMDTGVLNARYDGLAAGSLTAYTYLLSYENAPEDSTRSHGLRFSGESGLTNDVTALYTLEVARQSDYDNNPDSFDTDYYRVEAGARSGGVTAKLGQELLGSDDGTHAFQTPLATLHAMNGWADKFLSTPDAGLRDTYASVATAISGVSLKAVHHRFESDEGSNDYGSETGLVATWSPNSTYTVGAKAALYQSEDGNTQTSDTDKAWLWVDASF
ncbi:alginate export family protein [Vreelandella utahensis]|uniref:alginate export family protein n=1 Tax=Vreelandella halophila TaxID=86177 RepID=UPI001C4E197C|nr:alginate export family protein [Halomonas utahensis]